jgi:uncharacterized membrane protein YphA (DoxX/SURF4 family)
MVENTNHLNWAKLSLKIGLSFAFGYAAVGSFLQPDIWIGYLPGFIGALPFAHIILTVFSLVEIILVLWLLSGKFTKYAAAFAGLMLVGIVTANFSDFTITFRDLALIFSAIALFFLS